MTELESHVKVLSYPSGLRRCCPQGSVLGLACWNLMFDGLLRILEKSVENRFVVYADDLVMVMSGNSSKELEG